MTNEREKVVTYFFSNGETVTVPLSGVTLGENVDDTPLDAILKAMKGNNWVIFDEAQTAYNITHTVKIEISEDVAPDEQQ